MKEGKGLRGGGAHGSGVKRSGRGLVRWWRRKLKPFCKPGGRMQERGLQLESGGCCEKSHLGTPRQSAQVDSGTSAGRHLSPDGRIPQVMRAGTGSGAGFVRTPELAKGRGHAEQPSVHMAAACETSFWLETTQTGLP